MRNMAKLKTEPNTDRADEFYKALASLHEGKDVEQSLLINSKLILTLANHIGNHQVLKEAIELTRGE